MRKENGKRGIGVAWLGYVALGVFFLSVLNHPRAQGVDLLGRSELVLTGGGMNYLGDLNDQSAFGEVHAAFGAGIRCRLDNRWALRVEGNYGRISALEDCIAIRNLSFRSSIYEGSLVTEFNFRPYGAGATEGQWTPYIFGGVAVFHFTPEAQYTAPDGTTSWVALPPLCTEGQGTTAYPTRRSYPLTQLAFRKTWTDYLDDVSTTYVGSDLLIAEVDNGTVAAALADRSEVPNAVGIKRGDDSLDDWYSYFNLSVGMNLNMLFGWMRSKRCRN